MTRQLVDRVSNRLLARVGSMRQAQMPFITPYVRKCCIKYFAFLALDKEELGDAVHSDWSNVSHTDIHVC